MKTKLFIINTLFVLSSIVSKAQYCTTNARYTEQNFFLPSNIKVDNDVPFATVVNWQGQTQTLTLNVFYPKAAVDPSPKRPFILLIHGGGFQIGDKDDMNSQCQFFAQRGFVAATIDYRLGHNCNTDPASYDNAVYRADQDGRAALRFAVANASLLKIDTAWIFVGGNSAGNGTALNLIYSSQAEWNASIPNIQASLGSLYTSGNSLTNTYTIKGMYSNSAGLAKNFIQTSDMVPMIMFHGGADPTVDVDSAYSNSCVNPFWVYGSRTIQRELNKAGICNDLSIKIGGGHGVYNESPAATEFRVAKAACFFKSMFCNSCNSSFVTYDSIPATCSISTGLVNSHSEPTISVYPNPTKNNVTVDGINNGEEYIITVSNILGQQKLSVTNKNIIDLGTIPSGIYIFTVQQGVKSNSIKIVKE